MANPFLPSVPFLIPPEKVSNVSNVSKDQKGALERKGLIRVADNKSGKGVKPNKIRVNRNFTNSFSSKLLKSISSAFLSHKNLTTLLSSGCKLICKIAFSRSLTTAILFTRKSKRPPNNDDVRDGPGCKQSLNTLASTPSMKPTLTW